MGRHYRVTFEDAFLAHDYVVRHYGGLSGVRDRGAIESALARPYCGYYRRIEKKAAALVHSLILNHGFVDGNKRTAVFMLATLLTGSGYSLWFPTASLLNADVEEMVVAVAEHRMGLDEIATWIKTRLVKLPP